jgi:colicin import membrane protein
MSTLNAPIYSDSFNKFVWSSLAIHICIVGIFTIRAALFPDDPSIFQNAVQVDLVALPDKLDPANLPTPAAPEAIKENVIPEPKAPKPALAEKKIPKEVDPEAVNLNKTKKKETAAFDKLKQLSALEEIERQEKEEAKKQALQKINKIKGNVLSSGNDLRGIAKLQHENYISLVENHIRKYWATPEWLKSKKLSAQVKVRFDEKGNIVYRSLMKSSGNQSFDDLVIDTVEKASPVPIPPDKFVRILNVEGILLGFPE